MPLPQRKLSVIVPAFDEEDSVEEIVSRLITELESKYLLQIICIDDGSRDKTWTRIQGLVSRYSSVQGIRLRKQFGKSAALQAGFDHCTGDFVATIDADLQDDPSEIHPMINQMIQEDLDLVCGWKEKRKDSLEKRGASLIFNFTVRLISGVNLKDHNCGLKCFRRAVTEEIRLYGAQHRFLPVLAAAKGFRIGQKSVRHFPRRYGRSKFGKARLIHGLLDSMTVTLLTQFRSRPLHLIGGFGLIPTVAGLCGLFYLGVSWSMGERPIGSRPLLFYSIAALVVGAQMVCTGLVAELLATDHFQREAPYSIRDTSHSRERSAYPVDRALTQPLDC